MTDTPLVSVVIPAYNAEAYIQETVESVFAQTWPEFEIIVVNDGSTDATEALLRAYGDRIQLISQPNGGVAKARNTALKQAKGEYIAFLDADDAWLPDKTSLQLKVMQQYPDIAVLGSGCHEVDVQGKKIGQVRSQAYGCATWISQDPPILDVSDINQNVLGNCLGSPSGLIVRRECLEQVGYFDEGLFNGSEDWELYIRFVLKFRAAVYADTLFNYRVSKDGLCSAANTERLLKTDLMVLEKVFGSMNVRMSWAQRRKAYGMRYFKNARAFMENSQLSRARATLLRAVAYWPALLFNKPAAFILLASIRGEEWLRKRQITKAGV